MNNIENLNASNAKTSSQSSPSLETYLISALFVVIAAISVFGNILIMMAIFINRRLRTTSNYLLVALAVPDFFQGAVSLPLRLVEVLDKKSDHASFCRVAIPLSTLFGGTSNLHILLIATERFIAICWPFFYCNWVTTKNAFIGVGGTWVFMTIFSLLPSLGWGGKQPEPSVKFCRFPEFLTQEYITSLYVFVHAFPIVTVIFLNVFILRASFDHARRICVQVAASNANSQVERTSTFYPEQSEEVGSRKREASRQMKATKIVAAVVGSFILMVVPIITIDVVEMMTGAVVPGWIVKVTVLMIYSNHCVNVFVYAGFNSDYRNTFKKIFKRGMNIVRPERS